MRGPCEVDLSDNVRLITLSDALHSYHIGIDLGGSKAPERPAVECSDSLCRPVLWHLLDQRLHAQLLVGPHVASQKHTDTTVPEVDLCETVPSVPSIVE